ncbi:MAG: lipid-A-disaccharide synthase [Phycisphaerales bacterium]|nr:lipid-A-disaccharide synthase [Phycisphaerales bacterium]
MTVDLPKTILFTAFEPSGDAHAAGMISELRRRHPDIEVVAWGGPRMQEAGAVLMAHTAEDGVMGLGGLSRAKMLYQERARIKKWLGSRRLLMHVGVDSPSANVRIAPVTTATGAPYVQFVAPQYWAWAPWRLKRFKQLASLVLCILPFEQAWFQERGMPARFVGHPVVSRKLDVEQVARERAGITPPEGAPRIVILPGSRRSEIHMNMQLLVDAYQTVERRHPGAVGVILAAKDDLVPLVHKALPKGLPDSLQVVTGNLQGWFDWAELALNASGTVSLDLARQQVPMVAAYRISMVSFIGSKFILSMDDRLLPNIVAGRRIVPEYVPHLKGHTPIADSADRLLSDPEAMSRTRQDLEQVVQRFGLHDPAVESVDAIDEILERTAGSDLNGA